MRRWEIGDWALVYTSVIAAGGTLYFAWALSWLCLLAFPLGAAALVQSIEYANR